MAGEFAEVKVEGLNQVLGKLRRLGDKDTPQAIRAANLQAAKTVVDTAKVLVPRRTGALANTVRALATPRRAQVKAGSMGKKVPYGAVIHFGWARRHIRPQPFLYQALDRRIGEVVAAYEKQLAEAVAKFNG
jgi:HK97 gp10 family phage protein